VSWQSKFVLQGLVVLFSTAETLVIVGAGSAIVNAMFWLLRLAAGWTIHVDTEESVNVTGPEVELIAKRPFCDGTKVMVIWPESTN
jgi:hypothetical protein